MFLFICNLKNKKKKFFLVFYKILSQHIINNDVFKIERFKFITKELRHITKYLAKKRNITDYKSKSNDELLCSIKNKDNK